MADLLSVPPRDMPAHGEPLPENPHKVIEQIHSIDMRIAEMQDSRRQLINHYQNLMQGYDKHFHEVMNRPEQGEESVMAMSGDGKGRW